MALLLVDLHRGRRLLGRLLAREHALPARRRHRSRPTSSTPRRARSTRACRTASAGSTSTSSSRTSPSGWPTSGRCRAGRTPSTTRSRRPSPCASATTRVWEELHDVREVSPDDRQAIRARIRRLNDLGFAVDEIEPRADGVGRGGPPAGRGHDPSVPRARTGTPDRPRRARGPGTHPAQRPARVPGLAGGSTRRRPIDAAEAADRWLARSSSPSWRS